MSTQVTKKVEKPQGTAHIKRINQDTEEVISLHMTTKQLAELQHVISVAQRLGPWDANADEHVLVVWKHNSVTRCRQVPPCEGSAAASITLYQQKKKARA